MPDIGVPEMSGELLGIATTDRREMMPMERRVLVAGGAGFLGSHLCDRLVGEGAHVVCLDNFSTGSSANVAHLQRSPRFTLIERDVTLPFAADFHEVYNLASPASPVHYQRNPVETAKTNIVGAINLLELARATNAKILQASTSEVYGDPQTHPQTESYWGHVNPIGPRSCYDEGKRGAETLFVDYSRQYGTRIRIARIFNTYGPRMQAEDGRVVSGFIVQALAEGEVTVFGDGSQTRSFCYVDDLIDGMIRLMNLPDDFVGPVNLGNPEEITIGSLAKMIVQLTHSSSRLVYRALPQDDPRRRCPDISKARRLLGWEPRVRLRDGLERTIKAFRRCKPSPGSAAESLGEPAPPTEPASGMARLCPSEGLTQECVCASSTIQALKEC